jgi:hypothetical protein
VRRFADAKRAASYAGLVPSTYHSGAREAYGRITKRGSGELRAMVCEAAHHASRPTHPLQPYFASLAGCCTCVVPDSDPSEPSGRWKGQQETRERPSVRWAEMGW